MTRSTEKEQEQLDDLKLRYYFLGSIECEAKYALNKQFQEQGIKDSETTGEEIRTWLLKAIDNVLEYYRMSPLTESEVRILDLSKEVRKKNKK